MNKIEVIVVTGMSGAGKTQAMAIFEIIILFHY